MLILNHEQIILYDGEEIYRVLIFVKKVNTINKCKGKKIYIKVLDKTKVKTDKDIIM